MMFHWIHYCYVFKFIKFMKCAIHDWSDDPPLLDWLPKCAVMAKHLNSVVPVVTWLIQHHTI
jgi:hypothetical protein